jgi:hypothetical protein
MPDDVVNARGELTFAEQTRLLHTPQGTERLVPCAYLPSYDCRCNDPKDCPILRAPPGTYPLRRATPDDDPWYDAGPGPGVLPVVDDSGWGRNR